MTPLARRRRRSPRRRSLVGAAAVLAVAALAGLLWTGPLLVVRAVRVDGAASLSVAQVREVAGIEEGTPLLRVDVDAAAARVAGLPQVADVQVARGWPSTVVVTVTERVPLGVVEEAGRRMLVDASGVLFDEITGAPPEGVVRLEVAAPGPGDPDTTAALGAVAALPAEVRARVALVTARDDGRAVELQLADGTAVVWGDGEDAARKATVLAALLQQIEAGAVDPAERLDVSAPGAVVLR